MFTNGSTDINNERKDGYVDPIYIYIYIYKITNILIRV